MHEYSIVDLLIDSATRHAREARATSVTKLRVSIGELAGVDPSLLKKAFDTFRERTICERAELEIARIPAAWECDRCASPISRGSLLACPACGSAAKLATGGELFLDRVEMEVPDV